ncbi:hypothetical protein [uncultured Sphaerochaeta sp.]|uniref:hypothetical protein n=1 Tax=uncultured Sphaerochaeta sp. TaxID=886478 RepID=UPI002A0A8C02|nr:hypothetical protein [uncultured Sphaerochaeta sp.]
MKLVDIEIQKKDGTIISDIKAEIQGGGTVAVLYDLTVPVKMGDYVLTKKSSGRKGKQLVVNAFIDEMMGSMDFFNDTETSVKAKVLFLHGYEK